MGESELLSVESLTHRYKRNGIPAITDLEFQATAGITALLGANGAGKSTLLRILSGALRPSSGNVRIGGLEPFDRVQRPDALRHVALMPQTAAIPRRLRTHEFVAYLTWMRGVPRGEAGHRATEALERVGLADRVDARLGTLSGGMVRRVWLAQALAARTEVLLLDEPSTGLDPRQRATMVDLVREHAQGTVLLSSHLVEDVASLADRVLVLEAGSIVFDGPVSDSMDSDWLLSLIRSPET